MGYIGDKFVYVSSDQVRDTIRLLRAAEVPLPLIGMMERELEQTLRHEEYMKLPMCNEVRPGYHGQRRHDFSNAPDPCLGCGMDY